MTSFQDAPDEAMEDDEAMEARSNPPVSQIFAIQKSQSVKISKIGHQVQNCFLIVTLQLR